MNIVLWVIAGVLALAFLAAGSMKLSQPKEKLAAAGMGWTEDFSPNVVKTIGGLELLAALGLILPAVTGVATVSVPLAALGLVFLMLGAAVTHSRRKENPMIGINVVLAALAMVVVIGRFGSYAF